MNVQANLMCGALIAVGAAISGISVTAGAENPPPVVVLEFEIDRQVDPVRYVKTAVLSNNVHRDTIMEFTATRTDLPDTRERWTVVFEDDPEYEHIAHVEINGEWIYSSGIYLDANDDSRAEMTVSGQTVSIDMAVPCADPNLQDYEAVLVQTAIERTVVGVIVETILGDDGGNGQWENPCSEADCENPGDFENCDAGCGPPLPSHCEDYPDIEDCGDRKKCCKHLCENAYCSMWCECTHCCPDSESKAECMEASDIFRDVCHQDCKDQFDECEKDCP